MRLQSICLFILFAGILNSCTREETGLFEGEVIKQWTIPIAAVNINPAPAGHTETGTLTLQLLSDNSIRHEFTLQNLSGTPVTAELRAGDPLTNGALVLDLSSRLSNIQGTGIMFDVRQSLVDSLLNDSTELYFVATSSALPNGFARGQIHNKVTLAADVTLTGSNEVPPVTTTARGVANIRLTENKKLYSRVTVTTLEVNDALTAAHIHRGAAGVNGPVLVNLALSAADFGVTKISTVDSTGYANLINEPKLYVNAHTVLNPAGKIRGQLR